MMTVMETKQRSVGVTTSATDSEEPKENVEQLKAWLEHFARIHSYASGRKDRLEDLMRRRSAKKWSAEKTTRMVRRLMTASKELEESESAIDLVRTRLSQNGLEEKAA